MAGGAAKTAIEKVIDGGNSLRSAISRTHLTRMRPSWSHKLKHASSEKTTWCQSTRQVLYQEPIADAAVNGLP
ncbi:hypothetical protein TNCV_1827461 [Trichonephila clavipes]|nr:hypothetical protein TNCV_1827461 [Trichonephila clavipes]